MTTTSTPPAAAALLAEWHAESRATRSLLEAVPADRLDWKPHPRSLTLGQTAHHVAAIPGQLSRVLQADTFDFDDGGGISQPASQAEILEAFDTGLTATRAALETWSAEDLAADWTVSRGGRQLMVLSRAAALRAMLFNHLYHHRGQLTVYLRLLDIPLPSVYGPSADVDPFAGS